MKRRRMTLRGIATIGFACIISLWGSFFVIGTNSKDNPMDGEPIINVEPTTSVNYNRVVEIYTTVYKNPRDKNSGIATVMPGENVVIMAEISWEYDGHLWQYVRDAHGNTGWIADDSLSYQ